ncbi:uncharacterized protein METZ01_LOCUS298298, partial [marine metagenome]
MKLEKIIMSLVAVFNVIYSQCED